MPNVNRKVIKKAAPKERAPKKRNEPPQSVLEMLRSYIETNIHVIGQALPPERVLAEKFGVGRPSVREGIKALTILDVLESRRGSGTYVKSLTGLRSRWPEKVELSSSNFNLLELLEVRKMLEPAAARLAATRATEADLDRIERACKQVEKDSDWDAVAQHDIQLHTAIMNSAGNRVLSDLYSALTDLLKQSRLVTGHTAPDLGQMLTCHRQVVNAILRGEAEAAGAAMLEHLHLVGLDLIANRKR